MWLTICRYEQAATSRVADAPEIDWDYYASQLPEYNMAEIKVRLVGLRRCAVVCLATGRVSHISPTPHRAVPVRHLHERPARGRVRPV